MPEPYLLSVGVPTVGRVSETFIRRHVRDVLPGQTSVVAWSRLGEDERTWDADGPALYLRSIRNPLERLVQGTDGKLKLSAGRKHGEAVAYSPRASKALTNFLTSHGSQALLVNFLDFLLPFIGDVRKAGVRWYSFGHGFDISFRLASPWWRDRYQETLPSADGIFVRAEMIRNRLIDLGLPAERIHVVRGGVDVPLELPPYGGAAQPVKVLAVGRMVPKKAPLKLLESVQGALRRGSELHLHYIGDGPLLASAKRFVADNGLGGSVTLYGARPPSFVAEMLQDTGIFVQHSVRDVDTGDEEGLPASITEAMAHAIPVVSTLHAGIPEAVYDGVSGFLVEENDSEHMGERIAELAADPAKRLEMGKRGWETACALFRWEDERKRLLGLMGLG